MTACVYIADPGGFNQQRVPVNGAARSWAIGTAGTLSAEAVSADLVRLGLNDELRGHRITVLDDDAGTWGGIVTNTQAASSGTTEIAAEDWGALFSARRLPKRLRPLYGPAGAIALVAITETTRQYGTPITERTADDIGLPVSFAMDGGDLRPALDSMANQTGQEWWIDPDTLAFHWGIKGSDLTGTVQLVEGRHIADWRAPTELDAVINDLEAFPTNDRFQRMQTVHVENAASIAAVGRRQGSAGIDGGSHGTHIRNRAIGLVNDLSALGLSVELDLVNVDKCFAWFREGDTICVLLHSASVQMSVRVLARSLADDGTMSVSGDVVSRRFVP